MSTLLELAGMAGIVRGVDVLLGVGAAWLAAGILVVFVGSVTDDGELNAAVRKSAVLPLAGYRRIRRRLKARSQRRAEGQRLPAVRA